MKKIKIYVLTLSKVFPSTHNEHGEETHFEYKFMFALAHIKGGKFHTIRANYELWQKRFEKINAGRAMLSVRQWSGKPYQSKQLKLSDLELKDGIGLQKLSFPNGNLDVIEIDGKLYNGTDENLSNIATNDGLFLEEWREWFKDYDLTKPMAIIQFTKFRY